MARIITAPTADTTRATSPPAVRFPRESRKPSAATRPTADVVLSTPGRMIDAGESWLAAFVTAAGSIQKATSAKARPRTSTGTILPGRNKIQPSVSRTTKASARASASRRMTPAANRSAVSTTAAICTSQNQPYPPRTGLMVCILRVAASPASGGGRLAEDHGHVVEVGKVGFEERLADPVLAGVENVVDAHLGGGHAAQGQ